MKSNSPPTLANWCIKSLVRDELHEEFFGDLEEIYQDRIATQGRVYAKWMYWVDACHLLLGFSSLYAFRNQNTSPAMYRHYLRSSGRNLARNKAYAFINILSLAVGMGVCLTISQYLYFEWSYDRFHKNFQHAYRILIDKTQNDIAQTRALTTYGLGPIGKETIPEIGEYIRILTAAINVKVPTPDHHEPFTEDFLIMHFVDTTFLEVFNFPLKWGDRKSVFDEKFNIVITEKMAHTYFGDDNPIGKTLRLLRGGAAEEGDYTVSGVLKDPPTNSHLQFQFLLPIEGALRDATGSFTSRDAWERNSFITFITIDESANVEAVGEKLEQLLIQNRGSENAMEKVVLQPMADIHLKSTFLEDDYLATNKGNIQDVKTFSIIALFILIIAWINYINLATARSMNRAKEVGVRKSIGALRKQLISQFMLESVLVNVIAAFLAIGIAFLTLPILGHIIGRELVLSLLQIPLFWGWFLAVIMSGSLLSGLYPAFVLSAFKPISMLGFNKTARTGKVNLRKGLIVFQFLASLLLIAGTYLIYQQTTFMKNKELGIDMERILVLNGPRVNLDRANLNSTAQAFRNAVGRHHSIAAVAGSGAVPGKGHNSDDFRKLGDPVNLNQHGRMIWAGLDFPETYDFEFLAGSSFTPDLSSDESVVIINEEAVRAFGLGSPENALQETLIRVRNNDNVRPYRVIGVVKNFHWHSLRNAHAPYLLSFAPHQDNYFSFRMNMSNIAESLAYIERTYQSFFPGNPFDYFFLDDAFNQQYQAEVRFGNLFLFFTVLTIFIACIGLFALVSYAVSLRTKEIGIRKVLGARVSNLMLLLSKEYLMLLAIAIVLAVPVILYWGSGWLENYAFRIGIGLDLFMIPTMVLELISFLTVSYRAYSAARANPVDSLRME